jgi:hypothetical protein
VTLKGSYRILACARFHPVILVLLCFRMGLQGSRLIRKATANPWNLADKADEIL